eukprot:CAMPEP_0181325590 /NCGR_PEP_ID=MMETSP1101-20121128/21016_1 /TAXON_ID=46948 /ORGANISM="Rhodomonas abbreviata, Strain Caron Lab Isolate" /LENGTH=50 /DNA_ID=CAMNT_0023433927 /DNA_START=39 /DNA_END=191 /DNA_ORIENTATION=+
MECSGRLERYEHLPSRSLQPLFVVDPVHAPSRCSLVLRVPLQALERVQAD